MKNLLITFSLGLVTLISTPTLVHAQDDDFYSENRFELGAGYVNREIDDGTDKIDSSGIEVFGGIIIPINPQFSADTLLKVNYHSLDTEDVGLSTLDSYFLDGALSERFAYNIYTDSLILRPFVAFSLGYGVFSNELTGVSNGQAYTATIDVNYLKYGAGAGLQLVFNNGLALFARYDFMKYSMDDEARTEVRVGNTTLTVDSDISEDDDSLDGSGFTLGLSYQF